MLPNETNQTELSLGRAIFQIPILGLIVITAT